VQRALFSRLQPSVASSAWFGAIIGSLFAFVLVLLLSVAFSLTLGSMLDQGTFSQLSTGNVLSLGNSSSSNSASFYSNPLLLLTYTQRSTFDLNVSTNASDTSIPGNSITESVTPPLSLLLIIPAIGLIFGGYLAASTNYGGRLLFSITRGASICVIYALLVLIISLVASSSVTIGNTTDSSVSESLVFSPEVFSALLNALLWGLVFGALGGYLHSRSLPKVAPAGPGNRVNARIRGAFAGAGVALTILFALCLLVVIGLYILAQVGGPSLHTEGSPVSSGSAAGNCSIFLQQPSSSESSILPNTLATHVGYAIDSPTLAVWLMPVAMGAPFVVTSGGISINIGLFASSCGPGSKGALFYLFLLLPTIASFVGGWFAARSAQVRSAREAAGVALMMGVALTGLLLMISFYSAISLSVAERGLTTTATLGSASSSLLLAGLIFGVVLGGLGSVVGRPRNLPHWQPSTPSAWPAAPTAWPAAPAGWPQTPQGPGQPIVSPAIASYPPASPGPTLAALGDQPTIVTSDLPQMPAAPDTTGEAAGPEDPTQQTS